MCLLTYIYMYSLLFDVNSSKLLFIHIPTYIDINILVIGHKKASASQSVRQLVTHLFVHPHNKPNMKTVIHPSIQPGSQQSSTQSESRKFQLLHTHVRVLLVRFVIFTYINIEKVATWLMTLVVKCLPHTHSCIQKLLQYIVFYI